MTTVLVFLAPALVCFVSTTLAYRRGYRNGFRAGFRGAMSGIQAASVAASTIQALRSLGFRFGEPKDSE